MTDREYDATIYSDGGCNPNPGPGAWACIVEGPFGLKHEFSGFEPQTSNNRMEMIAALEGLRFMENLRIRHSETEYFRPIRRVLLVSDSQYLLSGIGWVEGWIKRGWRTSSGAPVKNRDLWERMIEAKRRFRIERRWVRGHAGHPENERCDELCRMLILTRGVK